MQFSNYGYSTTNPPISQNPFFFKENPLVNPSLGEMLSFNRMNTRLPLPVETISLNNSPMPMNETGYIIPNFSRGNASASTLSNATGPVDSFLGKIGLNQNNIGIIGGLASTLASLGGAYSSWRGARIADKQFNYNRGMMDSQYANALQDYNRKLSDTARSRDAFYTGRPTDPNKHFESDYTRRWEAKDNRKK